MSEAPSPASSELGLRVRARGVRRVFPGGLEAVGGVDLTIDPGAFVAFLGPSGCGKSTLLRMIAGLDAPDAGEVVLEDATGPVALGPRGRAAGGRHPVAFVFQEAHLLPWRTVLDNVALPLELAGVANAERRAEAANAIAKVGLSEAAARVPAELSGGMRMRVSLARALVTRPRLLLLDEPFAALDELTRNRLDDELRRLWRELGMTVLFVTHSITEAAYLAERAVVFTPRPARIAADVPIDLPHERAPALRTDLGFARATAELLARLEEAGA